MFNLETKVVVITGASGLLGREHARAVLAQGGKVALLDIDEVNLSKFFSELPPEWQKRTSFYDCDITNEKHVIQVSNQIAAQFGLVSGLVNNAAINPSVEKNSDKFERLEDITYESWASQLDVGLWGALVCSRVFGRVMIENDISGSIVNVSSDHGIIAPNQSLYSIEGQDKWSQPVKPVTYSVVKHGIIGLTRYLSTYWAESRIRVNALCPGGVLNGQEETFLKRFNALVPLGRPANSNEYRGAIVFLLSEESSYMTGSVLTVDGGRSVW
jgi:NAD(P)-dependent dehydrogenase (short-subunit alcohol dehydrogenase family)